MLYLIVSRRKEDTIVEETYLIKVKNLKPLWQRLGFSSEKNMLQSQKKYVILNK